MNLENNPETFTVTLALPQKIYHFIKDLCNSLDFSIDQWVQREVELALESWANGGDLSMGEKVSDRLRELMKEAYPDMKLID